jgi:peptidoglycan/LPS O-acetylase OafA/YrhL
MSSVPVMSTGRDITAPRERRRLARPRGEVEARRRHPTAHPHHRLRMPRDVARRKTVRSQLFGIADDEFRPDVEGLRAVAVVAVLLFHLRVTAFSGGFVGVDVFFVLSGFLITRLMLRELATTGKLSLPAFWARRARRLLPASVLVIIVTLLFGRLLLNPLAQRSLAGDATAAGGFVVNFVFANRLGDYFAQQQAASPLLHYWSLAVEEQFYLLWPLLLLALTRRPRQYRRLLLATILAVAVASLVTSVWMTDHHPTWAFYLLPARMVELLAGAALAAAGPAFRPVNPAFRAALGWFGLLGIAVAVLTYDSMTAFPGGATLLPVLATVLVIAAGGSGASPWGPVVALRQPAAQWIGRHSYAIYLWHWPALVLVEARWGAQPLGVRLLIVGLAIGLAAVSFRFVENPLRHSPWLARRPRRSLAMGASLCLVAILAAAWMRSVDATVDSGEASAPPTLQPVTTTAAAPAPAGAVTPETAPTASLAPLDAVGLAALVDANQAVLEQGLAQTNVPSNLRPDLRSVGGDRAEVYRDDCVAVGMVARLTPCAYGVEDAPFTIILYGDSHAAQWFPALESVAEDRGAELIVLAKGGCPTANVSIPTNTLARTCPIWRDHAIEFIEQTRPELLVMSTSAGYPNSAEEWAAGFENTLSRVTPLARNVVVLGDTPPTSKEPTDCLIRNVRRADACASARADVVATERLDAEREIAAGLGATYVDTTDWLCTAAACPLIIGDILLYRDTTHITTVASLWFRPLLEASLGSTLP